jgi:hypothetical protein
VQTGDTPRPAPLNYETPSGNTLRLRDVACALLKVAAGAVMFLWFIVSGLLSVHVVGAKLFLMCVYGPGRVWHERLTILEIPRSRPYPVSNGDFIARGHFFHFVISFACWAAMVVGPPLIVDWVWRLIARVSRSRGARRV